MTHSKKIFLIVIFSAFLFLHQASGVSAIISVSGPIIPCGSSGQAPCNICHIPYLIKNLADYMLYWIGIPLAIVMVAIAGFRMIVGSAKESEISAARTMITNAFIGIGIMLVAWIIVNTVMLMLTGGGTSFRNALFTGPWNQLPSTQNCPLSGPVGTGTAGGGTPVGGVTPPEPAGGAQGGTNPLVDSIENNPNITVAPDSTGDCFDVNGKQVGPQTTLDQADHNQPLTVCSAGCAGQSSCATLSANPTLNKNMLAATTAAANAGYAFTITSITTGSHSANSQHYQGNAEDLTPSVNSPAAFDSLRKFFSDNKQLYKVDQVFCENQTGVVDCGALKSTDTNKHVHVQFKR